MIFSRLERGLMQAPVKAVGTGTSAEQWLTSNLGKYQMSKLESELAGLTDYLQKAGKGPVTREEMLDVVRKGQPKVEEVWYGKPELFPPDSYMDPDTGDVGTWEDWAAATEDFSEYGGLSQAEQLERLLDVSGEPIAVLDKNTKYSDYTLPGGDCVSTMKRLAHSLSSNGLFIFGGKRATYPDEVPPPFRSPTSAALLSSGTPTSTSASLETVAA